jgi:hypothetical protein
MAALSASAVCEIQSGATAGNVNGGFFNPANANMIADLTTTTTNGNTNTPIVKSATYTFVSTDVGHWLYIKSGTSWFPGWYKIIAVNTGFATLDGTIGSLSVRQVVGNAFVSNTVIGVASVATPTSGTFTIDYSQKGAAIVSFSNLGSASGSTTLTDNSSGGLFTKAMVGNHICLTSGTNALVSWYEIVSFTNSNSVVLNVTPHGANTMSATVGNVGGAISLGGSTAGITDNSLFAIATTSTTASMRFFFQGGSNITYTLGVAITLLVGTQAWPFNYEGYATVRGDRPTGTTRPTIASGANAITGNVNYYFLYSLIITGTAATLLNGPVVGGIIGCKIVNTSTTAARLACAPAAGSPRVVGSEFISYNGIAYTAAGQDFLAGNWIHDSATGISISGSNGVDRKIINNIVSGCTTTAINNTLANVFMTLYGNTIYGAENKLGTGYAMVTGASQFQNHQVMNNIFYGLSTAISSPSVQSEAYSDYNDYFNNTNDINTANQWQKGPHDIAVNPSFTAVTQVTGTTATTTSGNHLVDSGASFITAGVTAGRDYLYVVSGTGVTAGIYGIVSVDSATQITVDNTLAADATANKVYQITIGQNFLPTGLI